MDCRTEILNNGTVCYISDGFTFGADALLLADFALRRGAGRTLELCSGCGIVALKMADGGHQEETVAVELLPEGTELLKRSVESSGLRHIRALTCDLREYKADRRFDACVCNPPYFSGEAGKTAAGVRGIARSDSCCTPDDLCAAAARNLKEGGKLLFCFPVSRLQAAFAALSAGGFSIKAVQLVRHSRDHAPRIALIDARYRGGEGLEFLPDLIEHTEEPL